MTTLLKTGGLALLILISHLADTPLESTVYVWNKAAVKKGAKSEQRSMLDGSTLDFEHLEVHATTLPPRQAPHPAHKHDDEELVIIKDGELTITIAGQSRILGPGSVALMMPGDEHGFENRSAAPATYYLMLRHLLRWWFKFEYADYS